MSLENPTSPVDESHHEQNELRKIIEKQLEEYARGIDPDIEVESKYTAPDPDTEKYGRRLGDNPDFSDGLHFVFKYKGQEGGYLTEEVTEETLADAQNTLNKFYRHVHNQLKS